MKTDDTRRRLRPRDPYAVLFCMKCQRVKSTAHFGYQESAGRYRTQCNACRSAEYGKYAYRRIQTDPGYYDKLLKMNEKSRKRTKKKTDEYRRMVQARIANMLKDLKANGVLLKDIAAEIGMSPRHFSKFSQNRAGRTPWDTLERVEQVVERLHRKHVKPLK